MKSFRAVIETPQYTVVLVHIWVIKAKSYHI